MAKKKHYNDTEKKFQKSEHGKKLYKNMMIWTIIFLVGVIVEALLFWSENEVLNLISTILSVVNMFIFAISLFMNGRYQGAFEMYNKRLK